MKNSKKSANGATVAARVMALVLAALMVSGAAYYLVATIAGLI